MTNPNTKFEDPRPNQFPDTNLKQFLQFKVMATLTFDLVTSKTKRSSTGYDHPPNQD